MRKLPFLKLTNEPVMEESQKDLTFLTLHLARLSTAIRFLTVIGLKAYSDQERELYKTSVYYFPVVGFLIGLPAYLGCIGLLHIFSQEVVAIIGIIYLAFISNCLHLDGLSDSGDGLLSSRSKEKSLAIMKDSRVGAMGVIAIVTVMIAKYAALSSMSPERLPFAMLLMPYAGRCAILLTMATVQYARPEGGLGEIFYTKSIKFVTFTAYVLLSVLLLQLGFEIAFVAMVFLLMASFLFNRICKRRIGGATGDTLGANCELAEMVMAISFTVII